MRRTGARRSTGALRRAAAAAAVCLMVAGCSASAAVAPNVTSSAAGGGDQLTSPTAPAVGLSLTSNGALPGAAAGMLTAADLADFRSRFGDAVGVAVMPLDGSAGYLAGDSRTPYAWSTSKVLVVAALLREVGGADALSDEQKDLITGALTASDNESAALLMADLEERLGGFDPALDALTDLLRRSGDATTAATATDDFSVGETIWPLADQARFMAQLRRGCLLDPASTQYLFTQMAGVIDEQRWGLGQVNAIAFKGGWDVDDDDLLYVRQVGVVRAPNGGEYVVALSARTPMPVEPTPSPATFDAGGDVDQQWLDGSDLWESATEEELSFRTSEQLAGEVARWVTERVTAAPTATPC